VTGLPKEFQEHFDRPRRVGKLPGATGLVSVENPACGDRIDLAIKVEAGKIAALRFLCHGCSSSVAAASALGDLVEGHTLAEAKAVTAEQVDAALGGLPPLRRHGADLAVEALAKAIGMSEARGNRA
jgi:NifU-like protein